jgi:antitoxin component YwqK of YwqJK toxin-antitoxin module
MRAVNSFQQVVISAMIVLIPFSVPAQQGLNQKDGKGLRQGMWQNTYSSGSVKSEGLYRNDKPVGLWKYFYETGEKMALLEYLADGITQNFKLYHQSGSKAAEGLYVKGKKNGTWYYYAEDSVLIAEENYKNGLKDGLQKTFYRSGKLYEQIMFVNGRKEGIWKQYFESGIMKLDASYRSDTLQGKTVYYHMTGKKQLEGTYLNGLRNGPFYMFDETGKQTDVITYYDGQMSKEDRKRFLTGEIKVRIPEDVIYKDFEFAKPSGQGGW